MKIPGCDYHAKGALQECFLSFYYFQYDFEILVREGYMRVTSPSTCEWLKSKTSLAEYFKWTGFDAEYVPGGFWSPVENAFGIKRHSLRKLAGNNANPLKRDISKDFERIKPILEKHRQEEDFKSYQTRVFRYIKFLVLNLADENFETLKPFFEIIHKITTPIVDKNVQNQH
jgi:hypothetical protein